MNLDDTVSGAQVERLRFIKHKGKFILMIDLSHCSGKEMLLLIEQIRVTVARHEPGSMLTLSDFTEADIDKKVATRMKEVLTLNRPYVKRSACVGADSVPHVFYENIKSFSQREFPTFKTRAEAMDWLASEPSGESNSGG